MLVNGEWTKAWDPVQGPDEKGRFNRETAGFRNWISAEPGARFTPEKGRYHLYAALICPWACRILLARKLMGLEDAISVSIVEPVITDQGWRFGPAFGADEDPHLGVRHLHEIYTHSNATYTGRATVPVLWDKRTWRIVNNESADILKMLAGPMASFGSGAVNLRPDELIAEMDALSEQMYHQLNNGVYKSGFASKQDAYEEAVTGVFDMLEALEERLSDGRPYLMGDALTEVDIRLFVTAIRFDAAYVGAFKCNLRQLADYKHLSAHMARIYALAGAAETVNFEHIKAGYYNIEAINPTRIVPKGPAYVTPGAAT